MGLSDLEPHVALRQLRVPEMQAQTLGESRCVDPLAASEAQTPKWDRRDKDHALHPSHPTTELSEAVWPDFGA